MRRSPHAESSLCNMLDKEGVCNEKTPGLSSGEVYSKKVVITFHVFVCNRV
jgi:hypothetical protein